MRVKNLMLKHYRVGISIAVLMAFVAMISIFNFYSSLGLASRAPADSGPLSPLFATRGGVGPHESELTSQIQNREEDSVVGIPLLTRSQMADFEGYAEGGRQGGSPRSYETEHSASSDAGWIGIDNSKSYQNWAPSSDRHLIESAETRADWIGIDSSESYQNWEPHLNRHLVESTVTSAEDVDKYGNGDAYEDWQPLGKIETGAADRIGYDE